MNERRLPPHDLDAERSIIGAMLLSHEAIRVALSTLQPIDFYRPQHQAIFAKMVEMRADGEAIDSVSVAAALKASQPGEEWLMMLVEAQNSVPAISSAQRYADIIANLASLRSLIHLASDVAEAAYAHEDVAGLIDRTRARLTETALRAMNEGPEMKLVTFAEFVAAEHNRPVDWVVPGVLARSERCLVVAPEGTGKGVLLRQMAIAVAGGVHPFSQGQIAALPTLYLDLENPGRTIAHQAELTLKGARRLLDGSDMAWLLHEEAGLDLRSSAAQVYLERAMEYVQPAILCIGPIYKATRKRAGENWEEATLELLGFLDEIRTRFRCALIMEHHAPKGAGVRELVPFGSSAWMRWPDYGIKMEPVETDRQGNAVRLAVGTFRGNRMKSDWPDEFVRGGTDNLPWLGRWKAR